MRDGVAIRIIALFSIALLLIAVFSLFFNDIDFGFGAMHKSVVEESPQLSENGVFFMPVPLMPTRICARNPQNIMDKQEFFSLFFCFRLIMVLAVWKVFASGRFLSKSMSCIKLYKLRI